MIIRVFDSVASFNAETEHYVDFKCDAYTLSNGCLLLYRSKLVPAEGTVYTSDMHAYKETIYIPLTSIKLFKEIYEPVST